MNNHQDLDCYKVLALKPPRYGTTPATQQEVKEAYRSALLSNHPDKLQNAGVQHGIKTLYSVDEITYAYKTLTNIVYRLQHERQQKLKPSDKDSHSGIETVDLDELHYDCARSEWHCGCRCGDATGFSLMEIDLHQNSEHGDVVVECRGCSLRLKVTFTVGTPAFFPTPPPDSTLADFCPRLPTNPTVEEIQRRGGR